MGMGGWLGRWLRLLMGVRAERREWRVCLLGCQDQMNSRFPAQHKASKLTRRCAAVRNDKLVLLVAEIR